MRKTLYLHLALLCCLAGGSARAADAQGWGSAAAEAPSTQSEIDAPRNAVIPGDVHAHEVESLRRRIEDVEKQNRELLQMLTDIKARMEPACLPSLSGGAQASGDAQTVAAKPGGAEPSSPQQKSDGGSGFYGFLKTARAIGGRTEFRSQLVNIDFTLPLHDRLALRGEGWWGRNMSDVRGGAGQGINAATGREIRGRGGWAEADVNLSRYFSLSPGFSTDDPVDADVPTGGRTRNRAFYLANRITPNSNFLIGADYLRWKTNYRGLLSGVDDGVNLFFQYNF